ncbi:TonB-dependent receptor [Bradymonadaceae bacterium TMQ3]|nr:TonB-dependent receptor [Bradymonadaceae bacterium TMQ3]TXC67885.1 TonB-dependent receptor [Bradymonadales bacterium TMQ1]
MSRIPRVLSPSLLLLAFALPTSALAQPGDDTASATDAPGEATQAAENTEESSATSGEPSDNVTRQRARAAAIHVIGEAPDELEAVPGSAEVITREELERQRPLNANEALQMVPGVAVQDEEGMGLRQNIGIRGLNPNRSRKVLMLQDGVPIALAPYGEPEMYYVPPIDTVERIEVVKGSGSVLFGPQTIGGVINYITPAPPEEFAMTADLSGGTYGYGSGRFSVGNTHEGFGYLVSGMHQRFTGPRNLNLVRSDFNLKLSGNPADNQALTFSLGIYDETSASTYLGLTTPQYETNPDFNFAENDQFTLRRYAASLTHAAFLGDSAILETRFYAHNIARNWRRQDFDRSDRGFDYERIIDGQGRDITGSANAPEDGSTIFFRDSSGNRNREFNIAGVEPRLTLAWSAGALTSELQTGVRFHYEQTDEERINGEHAASSSGVIATDQERLGYALAAYALNRFMLLDERLIISPGARLESLWTNQIIYRHQVEHEDGSSAPGDLNPAPENANHIMALLPGVGLSFEVARPLILFAGAHRGWAPPRTKDAVTTDGDTITLEAETSWNYELGARLRANTWLTAELAAFLLDFQNQVVAPNEAGGAVAEGVINGGESTHMGAEASVSLDAGKALGLSVGIPVMANYTYVHSEFGEGWSGALQGQSLPYAPEHQVAARVGLVHPSGLTVQADANYVGAQFTDKVESVEPSIDGLRGEIDPRFLLGAQVSYTFEPLNLTVYAVAKNLLDQTYIASRSPRGIQPGMPRHIFGGLRWTH